MIKTVINHTKTEKQAQFTVYKTAKLLPRMIFIMNIKSDFICSISTPYSAKVSVKMKTYAKPISLSFSRYMFVDI